jgi:hypothetical protein
LLLLEDDDGDGDEDDGRLIWDMTHANVIPLNPNDPDPNSIIICLVDLDDNRSRWSWSWPHNNMADKIAEEYQPRPPIGVCCPSSVNNGNGTKFSSINDGVWTNGNTNDDVADTDGK